MKKSLAKKVTLSILAGAVLMSSSVVWARDITNVAPPGSGVEWVNGNPYIYAPRVENSSGPSASNNKVVFDSRFNGTVDVHFAGGYSDSGTVEKNTITIDGGTFNEWIYGGYADSGNANENTVTISGGSIEGNYIYGGYSMSGAEASNNIVTISGGELCNYDYNATSTSVHVSVYGGYAVGATASSNNNTVNIGGSADLEYANLSGSNIYGSSGNILNVGYDEGVDDILQPGQKPTGYKSWENGKSVNEISKFQTINFKNLIWENKKTVLLGAGSIWLSGTTIDKISIIGGIVKNSEYMNLISANSINGTISNDGQPIDVTVYQGVATEVELDAVISVEDTDNDSNNDVIKLTINDTKAANGITAEAPPVATQRNDQVLVLGESRAAAVAFTNQGSELIETGLDALARDNSKDTKVFAAVYGNHSEYETGSHVNVNGWSGIVGIGKTNANGLTVGAFFENGEGNYSTHNIFTNDYIRGDGEACYNGGGLLVRKDNANGVYAEASLRAGNLQNELRNAVRNGSELTGYDIDTFYYGAHVGVGKVIARGNDGDSIDVYGKFIYTHHDGETFDIGGTATKFDSVESERLRLGFRINEVQTNKLSMYYGAAWEYEFNGDAHDKIASFDLETPSLEGSTVIGEIGAHYKASDKWSIDLNGRAYVGQREGFSGSVQANYSF